jgi:hypothetical protein
LRGRREDGRARGLHRHTLCGAALDLLGHLLAIVLHLVPQPTEQLDLRTRLIHATGGETDGLIGDKARQHGVPQVRAHLVQAQLACGLLRIATGGLFHQQVILAIRHRHFIEARCAFSIS